MLVCLVGSLIGHSCRIGAKHQARAPPSASFAAAAPLARSSFDRLARRHRLSQSWQTPLHRYHSDCFGSVFVIICAIFPCPSASRLAPPLRLHRRRRLATAQTSSTHRHSLPRRTSSSASGSGMPSGGAAKVGSRLHHRYSPSDSTSIGGLAAGGPSFHAHSQLNHLGGSRGNRSG